MPDQNDRLDPAAPVSGRGFVCERRPGGEVRDSDRNALRPQLCRNVIETQRKDIEHAAEQIDMGGRGSPTRDSSLPARGLRRSTGAARPRSLSLAVDATMPGRERMTSRQIRCRRDMASLLSSKGCEVLRRVTVAPACSELQQAWREQPQFCQHDVSPPQHQFPTRQRFSLSVQSRTQFACAGRRLWLHPDLLPDRAEFRLVPDSDQHAVLHLQLLARIGRDLRRSAW